MMRVTLWPFKPAMHDISTDVEDPPAFVDVLALRSWAFNAATYPGGVAASRQREAYPDIVPLVTPHARARVHRAARQVMQDSGWHMAGDSEADGRLEAVAVTPVLRFRDDVVVRLRDAPGGTRVDIRSASRIGRRDFGANARRVRLFVDRLREALA
jgi:uncharacterized protein (DUF1499 family)